MNQFVHLKKNRVIKGEKEKMIFSTHVDLPGKINKNKREIKK